MAVESFSMSTARTSYCRCAISRNAPNSQTERAPKPDRNASRGFRSIVSAEIIDVSRYSRSSVRSISGMTSRLSAYSTASPSQPRLTWNSSPRSTLNWIGWMPSPLASDAAVESRSGCSSSMRSRPSAARR